jgi:myo-inositol-1(or 4)-monophosphatase
MTRNIELEHARQAAIGAANKASEVLCARIGTDLDITSKGHADFVTEVDHQCEEIIKEELAKFDDSIIFMGEESTEFEIVGNKVKIDVPDTCWIVDPLDGTSNFSHSFGAFGVSIGLRVNSELEVGVIQAPITGDLVHATRGTGAWRESLSSKPATRLETSDGGNHFNIFATSVPFRHPEYIDEHMKLITKMFTCFEDMRRIGAASLELMWLAQGTWAAFVERFLKPWDVAAGALIVKEAGGIITDFSGDEANWLTNGEILGCASPRVHEQIMNLIE